MIRAPLIGLCAAAALVLAARPLAAQTDGDSEASRRIDRLVESQQGVLLPLDGALDPELSSVLLLPPPEALSEESDLPSEEDSVAADDGAASDPPPEDEATEAALDVVDEEVAVVEGTVEEMVTEPAIADTVDAGLVEEAEPAADGIPEAAALPEIDTMGEIVTAELGNPTTIGPWRLWLASHRTVREAQDGWQQLAKDNRDILGDLSPVIVMKDLGGDSGTFFRLQVGPLPDEAAAKSRCDSLKSRDVYCVILGPEDG